MVFECWHRCVLVVLAVSISQILFLLDLSTHTGILAVRVDYGGGCPALCNGHGICSDPLNEICSCYEGWGGFACSGRVCPGGYAWADKASATNTAHAANVECSAMGNCDRSTGLCVCRAGFTGSACQELVCPGNGNCNGRGRCLTLAQAAAQADYRTLWTAGGTYTTWDADMIKGCVCDEGYEGDDCSVKSCPKAADPSQTYVKEVVTISCTCTATCSGGIVLTFAGESTILLPYDAALLLVELRLEQLHSVTNVTVASTSGDIVLCDANGATTTITMEQATVGLPDMTMTNTLASSSGVAPVATLTVTTQGTKVLQTCSGRGICTIMGHCQCFSKYLPSNGMGSLGTVNDCGYIDPLDPPVTCPLALSLTVNSGTATMCSGFGTCGASFLCTCNTGYEGFACEKKSCTFGTTWFEEPVAGVAHTTTKVCYGRGVCNYAKGECTCVSSTNGIFINTDCGVMDCESSCGGNGLCSTMKNLALLSNATDYTPTAYTYSNWDQDVIGGCYCAMPPAIDNQVTDHNGTYRGYYAFAVTPWKGYNCARAACPLGDEWHSDGLPEQQTFACKGQSGVFAFSFRGAESSEMTALTATAADLETALTSMTSVRDVTVTLSSGTLVCTVGGTVTTTVQFNTEHGDLPNMVPLITGLYMAGGAAGATLVVSELQKGTTKEYECGGHGQCDETNGRCTCFPGYHSSDGMGSVGERGDCAYYNQWDTSLYEGKGESATNFG